MKKMLKWTILKSLAVIAVVGIAIYYAYKYFTGSTSTGSSGALTGNSSVSDPSGADLKEAPPIENLFMRDGEDVAVEFSEDVVLTDANGKTISVKKGNLIKGKLRVLHITGGTISAKSSKYYITPIADYGGVGEVEIDGTKAVAVISAKYADQSVIY